MCLGVFIYSQTTEFESYTSQMMSFYIFFAGIHLILLMLQNTLSIVESRNNPNAHHGVSCVKFCPVIAFSIVFLFFAAIQILILLLQICQVQFWSYYGPFYFFHNVATVHFFDWILYGCAALVQLIKIFNFVSHRAGHSSFEKSSGSHKCMSFIGLFTAFASLVLLIANMWLLTYYEHLGGQVLIAYNAVQTVVMIPLLHAMIINQESHGQRPGLFKGPARVSLNITTGNAVY